MAGLRGTGPAGPARSAAAAGHGIVNEPDDIVANERQELPGGDLHGPSKVILVNCALPNQVCRDAINAAVLAGPASGGEPTPAPGAPSPRDSHA